MLRHGIPRDVVTALRSVSRSFRAWGGSTRSRPAGRRRRARVRRPHAAGAPPARPLALATRSSTTASRGEVIGGDHLIAHISSNPLISRPLGGKSGEPGGGRPRALITYMRSMRETREMDG